jgi:glycine/D-amino acid oxidase-like deaminating enzyme
VLANAPLPFETAGALRFREQAQFNPVRYLVGLAAAVEAAGGRIFETTRVTKVNPGGRWRICGGEDLNLRP